MEHQVTITLPEEVFQPLTEAALRQGQTLEEFAARRLAQTVKRGRFYSAAEIEAAEARMARHIGAISSGDPHSADNERIDADLAREYGRGLDGDE